MTEPDVSDDMLMAYADGELETPEREAIAALAARDPAIAARIARFGASAVAARAAFASVRAEPVPERLIASVLGETQPPSASQTLWQRARWPIAASLVIASGVGGFFFGQGSEIGTRESLLAAASDQRAIARLAETPSETPVTVETGSGALTLIASATYEVPGGYCRQFRASAQAGEVEAIACTNGTVWEVPVAVLAGSGGYRPASEAGLAIIDLYLDGISAGGDIGEAAEAALIANGWR